VRPLGIAPVPLPPFEIINLILVKFYQSVPANKCGSLPGLGKSTKVLRPKSSVSELKIFP
jgi:hypothetical protein